MSRSPSSRRSFLGQIGGLGVVTAFGTSEASPLPASNVTLSVATDWDVTWLDRVRSARHRALFDAPMPQNVLDLAARYIANIHTVHGNSAGGICAVLNLRTRAVSMGLGDSIWEKYAVGEYAKVNDPVTGAPARRNINWRISEAETAAGSGSLERLQKLGAMVLVCDFALGHLATRLAAAAKASKETVYTDLRSGLVPGAVLVPSGIYAAGEAQNAGCAFIPT